jgi:acetyl-CoA synthetase
MKAGLPWSGYRQPPSFLNITREVLDRQVERGLGERPALRFEGGMLTYDGLKQRVDALASSLKRIGTKKGDLVLIRMPNTPEFAIGFLATVKLGALPVLVNSLLGTSELATILNEARPRIALTEASRVRSLRELRRDSSLETVICARGAGGNEIAFETLLGRDELTAEAANTSAEEPAFVVYTSGTTGRPKGIVHAHRWIVALGDLNRFRLPPHEDDVVMATGEWSFISALGHNLLFPLRNGVAGAILSGRATPENVLAGIELYGVTVLYSVATVYRRLLALPDFEKRTNLKTLRCANATGEALREATYHEWKERLGCEVYEHYGVSEFQLVIGQGPGHPVKPGSIGKPLPAVGVAILGEDCQPVPPGDVGRLVISSKDPGLFSGYYKDPERTSASLHGGWYHTGDLAFQDKEGYFFIAGRSDECFKSRGIFISPNEVENALQKHPAVIESAVIPEPDSEIGNRIRAVVVLHKNYQSSSALAESIRVALREHIAPFKVPHRIEFTEALPKSPVGKILRSELTNNKEQ